MVNLIISMQDDLPSFFEEESYKNIPIAIRRNIIFSLFHTTNWHKINPCNRIYILQELENIQATLQNRKPATIEVVPSDWKFNELLMDFGTIRDENKYIVRKNFIEDGILQMYDKDHNVVKFEVSFANYDLMDSILHEGYHMNTFNLFNNHPEDIHFREHLEYQLYCNYIYCNKISTRQSEYISSGKTYLYRSNPDEYYAFNYAEGIVKKYMGVVSLLYGTDNEFIKYKEHILNSRLQVENAFEKDYGFRLDYDRIYQLYLRSYYGDKLVTELLECTCDDIKKELSKSKSLLNCLNFK